MSTAIKEEPSNVPEVEIAPTTEKKKKKIKVAEMIIERCAEGLSVFIKSKAIEEFMKGTFGNQTAEATSAGWARGNRFYRQPGGLNVASGIFINATRHALSFDAMNNNHMLMDADTINASFLRMAGISEGKTFKFNGLYRESDIAAIAQSLNEGLKILFKEYNTPVCYEIEVTAEV